MFTTTNDAGIRHLYKDCDRLFRLPFHEPMQSFPPAGGSGINRRFTAIFEQDLRQQFDLSADARPSCSPWGLGLQQFPTTP
ncbi:hypothetical protein [Synechococcus elongatus]|uniref:hypothetical protein n=1 Tax=Synechococcus elongatus TaxID=32046 RepID=UPI0030CFE5ED